MDEINDVDNKLDEVMLPGFRFHPTDEELVGFYLKRKIQQRPLSIELIKQLDIYKYDPWDLPKLATTAEKEWYFYCPRDRKYRNSARPNRVTGAGFWKATGTDRPIYSSQGNKCIGLKKSLVFYKGRAAKGFKTDWMMHEFRLPSLTDSSPPKRFIGKTIPANDSWAICRIFKKTNSTAQRALSQSWVSPILPEPSASSSSLLAKGLPLTTESSSSTIHLNYLNNNNHHEMQNHHDHQPSMISNFSPLDFTTYNYSKPANFNPLLSTIQSGNLFFSPLETLASTKCTVDVSNSILFNMSSSSSMLGEMISSGNIDFGGPPQDHCNGFFSLSSSLLPQVNNTSNIGDDDQNNDQWELVKSIGFPFNLGDAWKPNLPWDSSTEKSTSLATAKCFI